jgi:transcriptional regulator with XRE-family HTH domain
MTENDRLKSARVLRAMTQLELASKLGTKEIEIYRFETGRSQPCAEMKRRIAELLQRAPFELFDSYQTKYRGTKANP